MHRLLVTVSLAALAIAGALPEALAYLKAGPNMFGTGHHRLKVPGDVAPPLDGITSPQIALGFRKLRTAYAGSSMQIRRASDNGLLNIGFIGFVPGTGNPWDVAAATAHCAATSCFIARWYNQGTAGATHDIFNATAANQIPIVFGDINGLAIARTTTNTQNLSSANNITPATGVVSLAVLGNRSAGTTGFCTWLRQNGVANRLSGNNLANQWSLVGGTSGTLFNTASDAAWHSVQGVINGAGSSHTVDGVSTLGTVTGNTVAGLPAINGAAAGTSCDWQEVFSWDGYVVTTAEKAAITANQRAYLGLP